MSGLPHYELLVALGGYVALLSLLHFSLRFEPRLFALKITTVAFVAGLVVMMVSGGRLLARAQGTDDGLVFYGALAGALVFVLLFAKASKTPFLALMDRLVPGLALGHAVGRVGCFLEGCCYGAHCDLPWAVHDAHTRMPVHPVQLYEASLLFVLGLVLWRNETLRLRGTPRPSSTGVYLAVYAISRFCLEFWRGDLIRGSLGPLSTSQWISLAILPLGVGILARFPGKNLRRTS